MGRFLLYLIVPGAAIRARSAAKEAPPGLRETLLADGRAAKAEIQAVTETRSRVTSADGEAKRVWQLKLQIQPADEPPFEVILSHGLSFGETPAVGEVLDVLYDPEDKRRTIVDPRVPGPAADVDHDKEQNATAEQ